MKCYYSVSVNTMASDSIGKAKYEFTFMQSRQMFYLVNQAPRCTQNTIPHVKSYSSRERRPGMIACPACWAMGTNELK
jgi:hypothetical protein